VLIFCRLWEEPGLKTSFARLLDGTTVQTDFEEAAFAFALNRLLDRMSKLRVGEWVKTIYRPEWKGLEPNHFYRALDFLAEHKGRLEEALRTRCGVFFNPNKSGPGPNGAPRQSGLRGAPLTVSDNQGYPSHNLSFSSQRLAHDA